MRHREEIKGRGEQWKGRAKQAAGDLTGRERMRREGVAEEAIGKAREGVGRAKRKTGEALEDLGEDLKR